MDPTRFDSLTPAERNVLRLALGRTNDQIASLLGVSSNTVATHLLAARRKLGNPSKGDAARAFQEHEAPHQELRSPSLVMADLPSRMNDEAAEAQIIREAPSRFLDLDAPLAAPRPENQHDLDRPVNRVLLLLLFATLIIAVIALVPGLTRSAEDAGHLIKRLHERN